jgi:hypothetical protein
MFSPLNQELEDEELGQTGAGDGSGDGHVRVVHSARGQYVTLEEEETSERAAAGASSSAAPANGGGRERQVRS